MTGIMSFCSRCHIINQYQRRERDPERKKKAQEAAQTQKQPNLSIILLPTLLKKLGFILHPTVLPGMKEFKLRNLMDGYSSIYSERLYSSLHTFHSHLSSRPVLTLMPAMVKTLLKIKAAIHTFNPTNIAGCQKAVKNAIRVIPILPLKPTFNISAFGIIGQIDVQSDMDIDVFRYKFSTVHFVNANM